MSALPWSPDDAARPPSAPGVPGLEISGLIAGYGAAPVLAGIDLTAADGTVTALLGPNGAGKTTLVRAICGRLPARSGRVRVAGLPAESAAARRAIGLVPQDLALYRALTVRENLSTFARLSGVPASGVAARVADILARTGLAGHAERRIDQLSGGWQRRANMAAALVGAPRLLLLDEPTVGVDAPAREELAALIRDLAAGGLAVLLVTHDFAFAEATADCIAILAGGRIAASGGLCALLDVRLGRHRIAEVGFARAPASVVHLALKAAGLDLAEDEAGRHGLLYRGLIPAGAAAMADLVAMLEAQGAAPQSVASRAAGLDALYAAVVAEATA